MLIATDADAVADEVDAALGDTDTAIVRVRAGADVAEAVQQHIPDLVVLDMQIGNMGAIAVTKLLRAESDMLRLPSVDVLLLLDREADVFLAHRAEADGWLIKPIDAFRLRRAAKALDAGQTYIESPTAETVPATAPTDG